MPSFKRLSEAFEGLHWSVQLVLCVSLLVAVAGIVILCIVVAINPLSAGSVIALITTIATTIAFVLGRSGPRSSAH